MKMKYIFLLLLLISTLTLFSNNIEGNSVQEITTVFTRRLQQGTNLNRAQIAEKFPSTEIKRAFLVSYRDNGKLIKYDLVLMDLEENLRVISFPKLVENPATTEESRKNVGILLALQDSLFSFDSILTTFSPTTLIMQDMGYINLFIDSYNNFIVTKLNSFKEKNDRETVSRIFNSIRHYGIYFSGNISDYLKGKELKFEKIIYEPTDEEICNMLQKSADEYFKEVYTQIDAQNFILAYQTLQNSVVTSSATPNLNSITASINYNTPLEDLFVQEKNMAKTVSMIFQSNLDLQKKIASMIYDKLNNLNKVFAGSYGEMAVSDLKDLLISEMLFQIFSYNNLKLIKEYGTEDAMQAIYQFYLPNSKEYKQGYIDSILNKIENEIVLSSKSVSEVKSSLAIFEMIDMEWKELTEYEERKDAPVNRLEKSKLIQLFNLNEAKGHYARIKSTINFNTDEEESFVKNYPIFSNRVTDEGDTVIMDFFWVAAKHQTSTIFRTLGSLIGNGFNFTKLEENLSVENIDMVVEGFVKLNPYSELWKMEPAFDRRVAITLLNNSDAKNAIKNIFAGYVPEYFAEDVKNIVDTENVYISRYPVEFYTVKDEKKEPVTNRKGNAIIFVHGKQQMVIFNENNEPIVNVPYVWRGTGRIYVWDEWYKRIIENREIFTDYDFYEFLYDTSALDPEQYGSNLANIMNDNGLLNDYDKIYIVSHSMGGLVSREAINTEIAFKGEKIKLGDKITNIFTIDTPHWGTIVQNFILTVRESLVDALEENPSEFTGSDMSLFGLIRSFLFGDQMDKAADLLIYFSKNNPEVISKLFSEVLSFLDPFPGGMSMEYACEDYDIALAKYLYPQFDGEFDNILLPRNNLEKLNKDDSYYEKLYLISAEVTKDTTKFTQGYYITFKLMEKLAELVSHEFGQDYMKHGRNDAVVPLFSQQIWGIDKGAKRIHYDDLDHDQVVTSPEVMYEVLGIINDEYGGDNEEKK